MWSATWAGVVSIGAAACAADPGDDLKTSTSGVTTPSSSGSGSSGGSGSGGSSTSSSSGSTSGSSSSGTTPPPTDDASDDTTSAGDDATAPASDAGPPMMAASCTSCPVQLLYSTSASNNQVPVDYRIVNQGTSPLAMSDLKVRYWFAASGGSYMYTCDYASVDQPGAGPTNIAGTQVMATFAPAPTPTAGAMQYMELSFPSVATTIPPSLGATVNGRFSLSGFPNIDSSHDYSYDAADTQLTANMKITVYNDGKLVWGTEPGGSSATTSTDAGDP
jgi:hypothetical protein